MIKIANVKNRNVSKIIVPAVRRGQFVHPTAIAITVRIKPRLRSIFSWMKEHRFETVQEKKELKV